MSPTERPLVGLKQIANHLQKSTRTVRRYARMRRFPVYRIPGTGTLFAFRAELNDWIRTSPDRVWPRVSGDCPPDDPA
jgi:hypothetical protein